MTELATGSRLTLLAPVVLDLDGDGADYVPFATSRVLFDMDGDGDLDRTSWVGVDDGLLVYDRNGNGLADNGSEISFQSLVAGAASDLEGLAFFDSNDDSVLDASDTDFAKFRVWRDHNQNGVADAGELRPLLEAGIKAIDLEGERTGTLPNGQDTITFATSAYLRSDDTLGLVADSFFVFEPSTVVVPPVDPPPPGPVTPPVTPPPALALASQSYEHRAKKYVVEAKDGSLFVRLKKGKQLIDARANSVGPAIILDFKNRDYGLLSPVILDLDGDGLDLKSMKKSSATFDMDGDGTADDTGWVGKGDGFLVIDRNNDGLITAASELSFLTESASAASDLDALGRLDSNRDSKISASDTRFGELKVWVDANQNGVSEAGELKSLTDLGITEISLASRPNASIVKPGHNVVIATSTFKRANGTTGTVGDVALSFTPSSTRNVPSEGAGANPATLDEAQLSAIRAALGNGTFPSDTSGQGASSIPDSDSQRLAAMTQAMASFGTLSGEGDSLTRGPASQSSLDWFAGSGG